MYFLQKYIFPQSKSKFSLFELFFQGFQEMKSENFVQNRQNFSLKKKVNFPMIGWLVVSQCDKYDKDHIKIGKPKRGISNQVCYAYSYNNNNERRINGKL